MKMQLSDYFVMYDKLSAADRKRLTDITTRRRVKKGTILYNGSECLGLLVICSGQLRAYISSEEGREITIYRLFERDICLFSASCLMNSIQFDITISAEKDTEFWLIPPDFYKYLMNTYTAVANYTNQIMATRFTDVMWLIEQVMWKSFDKRLADFLLEESAIEDSKTIKMTHEQIAAHLGTAREVVTRMLKYFQTEGMVKLSRGAVEITDSEKMEDISDK